MSASPDFDNSGLWDVRKGVVVFDEHFRPEKVKKGADGSEKTVPARDFKKQDLETICRNNNERDAKGLPCAVVIGHTTDEPDETAQPEIVGYDRNFRVEYSQKLGKNVIVADRYLRRERAAEAEKYPRTSVEHWLNQDFFDPIAIVKRTPKLDLPQWHYARRPGDIDRYAMEPDMASPTEAPDAAAPNPELEAMVMKCVMACLEKMKMSAGMAQPGPTNAAAPAAAPYQADGDKERFASEAERLRYTRQQEEIARLRKETDELKSGSARAESEHYVLGQVRDGIDVYGPDGKALSDEQRVERFLKLPDRKARSEMDAEIRANWFRAPVGGEMLRTYEPPDRHRKESDEPSEKETMAAVQRMRKNPKEDFDTALKHVRGEGRKTA